MILQRPPQWLVLGLLICEALPAALGARSLQSALCHDGKGLYEPCRQAKISECNTCEGLTCIKGYCIGPPTSGGDLGGGDGTAPSKCHSGKGPYEPCKQAAISECDTCQGLKCTQGYCGGPPPSGGLWGDNGDGTPPSKCHGGKGLYAPCVQGPISQCNTCQGLKCMQGVCTRVGGGGNSGGGESGGGEPGGGGGGASQAACVLPVDSFKQPDSGDGPAAHLYKHQVKPGYKPNWKNDKAVDLKTPGQNPVVRATEDGTVCAESWCCRERSDGTGDVYGWQFTLTTDSGRVLFYTHVDGSPPCGGRVRHGDVLGRSATGRNVNHLHIAIEEGDVCGYLRGCRSMTVASATDMLSTCE